MLDQECDLLACAVVMAAVGGGEQPSHTTVARVFGFVLNIDPGLLIVSSYVPDCFIVELPSPAHRVAALGWSHEIRIGNRRHHLLPWTQVLAESTSATLCFKVHICFEGIPPHAHQLVTTGRLLPPETLLERVDNNTLEERKRGCFSIITWTHDPTSIATCYSWRASPTVWKPTGTSTA
jgi:hypothetical protein